MNPIMYKAMEVSEATDKNYVRSIVTKSTDDLPEGDVLIKVEYSSLNYKDALSASGNKGVTRSYPHTPGIDAAGTVIHSVSEAFKPGDRVIVTGYDLGMNTSGGYGEYIRVPSGWVVPCPEALTLKESMIYGTAGFTAALSVYKLVGAGVEPSDGDVLVTGATGGVGSVAISLLNQLGYRVIAATGKPQEKERLVRMGAADIIDRKELDDDSGRPMLKTRWAGVIDTVGGNTLATALKMTHYGGSVTCCGNVASHEFQSSVYPFILRGVSLLGIDSVQCPMPLRLNIWKKLSSEWRYQLDRMNVEEVSLEALSESIDSILKGRHVGRTVVNHSL